MFLYTLSQRYTRGQNAPLHDAQRSNVGTCCPVSRNMLRNIWRDATRVASPLRERAQARHKCSCVWDIARSCWGSCSAKFCSIGPLGYLWLYLRRRRWLFSAPLGIDQYYPLCFTSRLAMNCQVHIVKLSIVCYNTTIAELLVTTTLLAFVGTHFSYT